MTKTEIAKLVEDILPDIVQDLNDEYAHDHRMDACQGVLHSAMDESLGTMLTLVKISNEDYSAALELAMSKVVFEPRRVTIK